MKLPHHDFDGAWKEALEKYFQPLMEICFPEVSAAVDWTIAIIWMDKELQEVFRGDDLGRQQVDKLVRVSLLDGTLEWILLHVEVQSQNDSHLPLRMYRYHHRLVDRYGSAVVSLAILADENPAWKPCVHKEELLGCRVRFEYPICKLLELDDATLQQKTGGGSPNPGAVVILACLRALRSKRDLTLREQWKWELTRRLYEGGFGKKEIVELYRLIGWFIALPEEMELQYHRRLIAYEKEKKMAYITFAERHGRKEGMRDGFVKGIREAILDTLDARFGEVPPEIPQILDGISDYSKLKTLQRRAAVTDSLEAFRATL